MSTIHAGWHMNSDDQSSVPQRNGNRPGRFSRWFATLLDWPVPPELLADPESARHAALIARFGLLGSLFGFSYATFYFFIGHYWGMGIILFCSTGVLLTPFIMRKSGSAQLAGHIFALTLVSGFFALCLVEGGVHGHAIGWLVGVPLCAILLLGRKAAVPWVLLSIAAACLVVGLDLAGITLPPSYDPKWKSVVTAAGYVGLVLFMFILGMTFEVGRVRAAEKMQRALEELAATNDRLVNLIREKNEFLEIATHDLKVPLTVIIGSAELLKKRETLPQSRATVEAVITASRRMRTLITNLLDVNAIEDGTFRTRVGCCDLGRLIEECVAGHQTAASLKKISIHTGTTANLFARADPSAALQMLDNLVSNALKFPPPDTNVYIHAIREGNFVQVFVRDEGPGIGPDDQKKLFQKFSRLTARPTGDEFSSGLGLVIVKRLAEAMGGSVECRSEPGAGATFVLRLPAWPDHPNAETPAAAIANPCLTRFAGTGPAKIH